MLKGEKMEILEMYAPRGSACRSGYPLVPVYITIHNTANTSAGADAKAHGTYLRGAGKDKYVSWHYAVDETRAVACIPENEVAWHAGDGAVGTGNRKSLAIEICENSDGNLLGATENAVVLTAMLCKKYNIPADRIVQHNHWTGKDCPRRLRRGEPYSWDEFLARVKKRIEPVPTPALSASPVRMSVFATGADRAKITGKLDGLCIAWHLEDSTVITDVAVSYGDQKTLLAEAPEGCRWMVYTPPDKSLADAKKAAAEAIKERDAAKAKISGVASKIDGLIAELTSLRADL